MAQTADSPLARTTARAPSFNTAQLDVRRLLPTAKWPMTSYIHLRFSASLIQGAVDWKAKTATHYSHAAFR